MQWVPAALVVVLSSALFGDAVELKNDCPTGSVRPKTLNCSKLARTWRTFDGTCNNDVNETWGASWQVYNRYWGGSGRSNDTDTLRKSVSGKDLPNPRVISTTIHSDQDFTSNVINNFFTFFGLFVSHDIEKPIVPSSAGCCKQNSQEPCLPISIPANDSFYGKFGVRCLEFARSCKKEGKVETTPPKRGRFQYNGNTVFLDLSQIYGSDESTARKLRTFSNGQLKTSVASDGQMLLPTVEQAGMGGSVKGTFGAGDSRVNMFPQLTAIYTIFVLEHNRVAMNLHATFPKKTDEWLYQQARRILIAIYQNVIYKEYLPTLIGFRKMTKFDLPLHGSTDYNNGRYPSIVNENAIAGNLHVFGLISGKMEYGIQNIPLRQTFFNSSYLQAPSGLLRVILGMSSPAQDFDKFVTAELTNHFLQQKHQHYGLDFVALTLQRGRDNTLATYVEAIGLCPGAIVNEIKEFSDLVKYGLMENSNVYLLKQVYADVRDIDLFTGGFSEIRIPGAVLGPTLACLQALQFYNLKFSDRLFFTHKRKGKSGYSNSQIAQIFSFSLKGFMCRNVNGYPEDISELLLLLPSDQNKPTLCKYLPRFNLHEYEEEDD